MQLIELLKIIGVPEETINVYIEKKLIVKDGDKYRFESGDLLINILTKCLACKIEPKAFLVPPVFNDYNDELDVLYTNLITKNYTMAADAVELIEYTQPLELLKNTLRKYDDLNEYVLKDSDYGIDPATINGLKKLERKLLLELELFDYMKAFDTIELIEKIYSGFNTEFPYIINNLVRIMNEMSKDHTYIGNSNDEMFTGTPDYVLELLLDCDDIYRAEDVIDNQLKAHPFSIEWNIYNLLMYQIKIINEKNLEIAKKRAVVNASYDFENEFALPETAFPRITKSEVKDIESGSDLEIDDEDYYLEYENALFNEGDFELAKEKLQQHIKQSALNYSDEILDYLNEEIDILIKNRNLGVDMKGYNASLQNAFMFMDKEEYDKALNFVSKCYNMLQVKNPRLYCMLGKIYYKLGDLKKSEYFYDEAFNYSVSPSDLEDMIEVYSINKKYSKVINVLGRYDYYMSFQNPKVHYLAASAYLNLKKYEDSKEELMNCTNILEADENLPIDFEEERKIVDAAEKGVNTTFGIDDYIEYEVTEDEYSIAQFMDENVEEASRVLEKLKYDKSNYSNDLKYALSVTKVLFQANNYDVAFDFCARIDEVFNTELLSKKDAKVYKKMLNNFKRI